MFHNDNYTARDVTPAAGCIGQLKGTELEEVTEEKGLEAG
jgi:hypothetical protein